MTPARVPVVVTALITALAVALAVPAAEAKSSPSGVQHLHYRFGPLAVKPGQNTIALAVNKQRPKVDGWITSFKPNLVWKDGKQVPPVDVIHLHHAVWLVNFQPTWAAGEEKTAVRLPKGYGWRYKTSDKWLLNHMIHNLTPERSKVWITWDIDFIPDGSSAARHIKQVRTQWMDVEGIKIYPVFDAPRGAGRNGRYTFPDQAQNPYQDGIVRNRWVADHDATLVGAIGHLHPGGLWTDLQLTRNGKTVEFFRSRAHYYEPAGAVSWDVSMGVTPPSWRVAVKKGDVLSVSGTYDTSRASWYEVMAIMPLAITTRPAGGRRPVQDERRRQRRPDPRPPARERQPRRAVHRAARRHPGSRRAAHEHDRHQGLRLPAGRPVAAGRRRAPAGGRARPIADVRQRGREPRGLPHDHRLQAAVQRVDRDRLPAGGRALDLRLRGARLRPGGLYGGRERGQVADAADPRAWHLHVLLPHPPVHARGVPGRVGAELLALENQADAPAGLVEEWARVPRPSSST